MHSFPAVSPAKAEADIAAERKPHDGNGVQTVYLRQFAHHRGRVGRQSRVVEPSREVLGAPAVPLIEKDDIRARRV